MDHYIGAVVHDETLYVHSGDRSLSALETRSGRPRWRHQFAASGYDPATVAENVLYINITADGAYALRSEDGAVLWHQPLGSDLDRAVSFTPSVVIDGAVYLVRFDRRGRGCSTRSIGAPARSAGAGTPPLPPRSRRSPSRSSGPRPLQ
jgi:outer membrane protein assembly factor BamB